MALYAEDRAEPPVAQPLAAHAFVTAKLVHSYSNYRYIAHDFFLCV